MSVVEYFEPPPGLVTQMYYALTSKHFPFYFVIKTPYVLLLLLAGYVTEETYQVIFFWVSMAVAFWKTCEFLFGFPVFLIIVLILRLCGLVLSEFALRIILALSTVFATITVFYLAYHEK